MSEKPKGAFDRVLGIALWICIALVIVLLAYWYLVANNLLSPELGFASILVLFLSLDVITPVLVAIALVLLIIYLLKKITN